MMDFLDPKKGRASVVRLWIGYALLAVAIVLAAIVLLYQASGFGVGSDGKVIQNGLVFVSSNPPDASIYLNGKKQGDATNTRLVIQSGTYTMRLARDGYRDWQRAVVIEGGDVEHVDYPFLVPKSLTTSKVSDYQSAPPLTVQSPDRRWLLAQVPGAMASFDMYDLKDPEKVTQQKTTVEVPAAVFGLAQPGQQSLELAEWSRDNQHVLLKHTVGEQWEYVLVSRSKPVESVNLTKQLQLKPADVPTMRDKKYDQYFVHDTVARTLTTTVLDKPVPQPFLTSVVAFKSYGNDVAVYATEDGASAGNVSIRMYQDEKTYTIRQLPKSDKYLLDISTYGNDWYAAVGSATDEHLYVYENVVQRLREDASQPLVPVDILKLDNPNYLQFSANSQFVMVENGQDVAVYDVENERSYTYKVTQPIDLPQQHMSWIDGYHLAFVSQGKLVMMDFDGTNAQTLSPASPDYLPFFDTSYQSLYTMTKPEVITATTPAGSAAASQTVTSPQPGIPPSLTVTSLRTERDR